MKPKIKSTGLVILLFLTLLSTPVIAPSQSLISWKDNFSDSTGISTIPNVNLYK